MRCRGQSCLESGRVVAEGDCLQSVHTSASNGLTHLALSHNTQKPKITIAVRGMGRTSVSVSLYTIKQNTSKDVLLLEHVL